jgi:enediyne biosynthesis protein E4
MWRINPKHFDLLFCATVVLFCSCSQDPKLFRLVPVSQSGISFSNTLTENSEFNVFDFEYVYNGGGVAIGDINNDGWEDIYFTGNTVSSKLYLNKGDLRFEDVTHKAGVGTTTWATGVTMADVNADGWLDIYVCVSGHTDSTLRKNLLFINNSNGTFTERAKEFGLASTRYSTQAAFFDFDKDSDLDMYLLNHSNKDRDVTMLTPPVNDGRSYSTDQLFENINGRFKDISHSKGIVNEGYGLGIVMSDFNGDGWTDVYVANDYIFNDNLYSNQNGLSFKDESGSVLRHTSHFSMGTDAADINNDGFIDVMVTDMMPPDNERQKKLSGPVSYNRYEMALKMGYHPSFMRNTLQRNNGQGMFQEIGMAAGIHETDWSWSVLLADYDNDSDRDIYITNGYLKNITDRDFSVYTFNNRQGMVAQNKQRENLIRALEELPGAKIQNAAFSNTGEISFKAKSNEWFPLCPSYSQGAAYSDLDNDGDLDLVVNNLNDLAYLFENTSKVSTSGYLQVDLVGPKGNTKGEGVKVELFKEGKFWQVAEKHTTRGYQSAVSQILHFGLNQTDKVDVLITWPDGKSQKRLNIRANQRMIVNYAEAVAIPMVTREKSSSHFIDITDSIGFQLNILENEHDDFNYEPLLLTKQSSTGPAVATADVDGNGWDDLFIGGATGKSARLILQFPKGIWISQPFHSEDAVYEDVDALFFDANQDSLPDLYVVSGGNEFIGQMPYYQDRLYLNAGNGIFNRAHLPIEAHSGSCVATADYDKDGDMDVFIGGAGYPQRYPLPDKSFMLSNEKGTFTKVVSEWTKDLERVGIVRSASWTDVNNDTWLDLVLVGDFMPLTVFQNNQGKTFENVTCSLGLQKLTGMWQTCEAFDFDKDGDLDFALGNFGVNTAIMGSAEEPFTCRAIDIDGNGSLDPVYSRFVQGKEWPFASRDQLLEQVPSLKKKFTTYASYSTASPTDVLGTKYKKAYRLTITESRSGMMINTTNGFEFQPFGREAQLSTINDFYLVDVNKDGWMDLLAGGNSLKQEATYGPIDSSTGLLLLNNNGQLFTIEQAGSWGLRSQFQLKKILNLKIGGFCDAIVCFSNQGPVIAVKKRL